MSPSFIRLPTPAGFDLRMTAFSHGWYDLLPFAGNRETGALSRVLLLSDGSTVATSVLLRRGGTVIRIDSPLPETASAHEKIRREWRTILRCDDDLTAFHAMARKIPRYRWIPARGAGRLLRAPTAFEDAVKMICTTNCTWGSTKAMVGSLVREFGTPCGEHGRAFPVPGAIAASTESILRSRCSLGYRAPYVLAFARQVASGELDPEKWRTSTEGTASLFDRIRAVKGIGPYAAGNLLKLVGRYDYLGLDSWVRSRYAALHHGGRMVKDRTIERAYREYGEWRGLFFWLEMTRYWHTEKFRGAASPG